MLSNNRRYSPAHSPYYGALLTSFLRVLTAALTANQTNRILIFAPTVRGSLDVERLRASCQVKPVDNDGTFLTTLKKYDASADAYVALTDALDLEASLVALESVAFVAKAGLSDADVYFDDGDVLYAEVVNNSAGIDTQPTELAFSGLYFIQDP